MPPFLLDFILLSRNEGITCYPHLLTILQVCTAKMNLSDEVDLEDYVSRPDKVSAAEIAAICQEAGMHAVRKNRCGCSCAYVFLSYL